MQSLSSQHLWLQMQCQILPHVECGVLLHLVDGALEPSAFWPVPNQLDEQIQALAHQALRDQRMALANRGEQQLLLAYPLAQSQRNKPCLVLTLNQRHRETVNTVLRRLKAEARWFALASQGPQSEPSAQLLSVFNAALYEPSVTESCLTLVNQWSHWLGCERVALGLMGNRSIVLKAVSNSAEIDPRTRASDTLKRAMQEAAHERAEVSVVDTENPNAPPLHGDLQRQTNAVMINSLPLLCGRDVIGVVSLEWHHTPASPRLDELRAQLPTFAYLLNLKRQAEQRSLGTSVGRQWRAKTRLQWGIGAAVFIALLLVALVPADYRIAADAQLQGAQKKIVVAKQEGFLAEVMARPGDRVEHDEPLARLDERELRLQRRKLASELQQYRQEYNNALANSERAAAAIAMAQAEQVDIQLELVDQQLQRTLVRAPMSGVIVSDDISQSVGKPLSAGEVLFEISSTDEFRVILYVDERDIVRVATGQVGTLVLSSLPAERFSFTVQRKTPVNEVREGLNWFRVEARLQNPSPLVQPGMTGTAKITVGREPLGWIALHRLFDWLRLRLWW